MEVIKTINVIRKMKGYKYRIYPSKAQAKAIDETIEKCRLLYNKLLTLKKDTYKNKGISMSRKDLYKQAKGNKEMHSQVSQNVADRMDKAFKNFFRRVKQGAKEKGFPRFKKYGTYRSITLPQITNPKNIGRKTYFPKIGRLNTRYHRQITGTPKTLTIKKAKSRKYFITVGCEGAASQQIKTTGKAVGIDLGLNHFIATSEGELFGHPKPMKKLSEKKKRLNRHFSKTKKRSNNRNKARTRLAITEEKIANIRNDFGWKLCNILIKKYGTIYCEDLNIKGMQKNHHLAKAITDVSWAGFLQKLSFRAESAGGRVVKVNPRNTSQICSGCGKIVEKTLAVREHKCPNCGLIMDRDVNSARNILTLGKIPQELREFKPVGDEASIVGTSRQQASLMNREAPCDNWG